MTRKEYLDILRQQMSSLSKKELDEALQYYEDYFEDANDDQKVMQDLGSPEQLAKTLLASIPGMPVILSSNAYSHTNSSSKGTFDSFDIDSIDELYIDCDIAEVKFEQSENFFISYDVFTEDYLECTQDKGIIKLSCRNIAKSFSFIPNIFKGHNKYCEITIHIPADQKLKKLCFITGVGSLSAKQVQLKTEITSLKVGTGSAKFTDLTTDTVYADCGMGTVDLSGTIKGGNLKCGMGSILIKTKGPESDYSINGFVGMGSLKFGNMAKTTSGRITTEQKKYHFNASVGMGDTKIRFE